MYWKIAALVSTIKVFLIPSYHSTDFEVHRNWLAITHSLPVREWYYEATSQWTLDYPPLFAWFEYLLAKLAWFADPKMLDVQNLNHASDSTILFQRFSVIITDFVFLYAVKEYCKKCLGKPMRTKDPFNSVPFVLCVMLTANIGLLLVDHMHFQYNGFLYGILLLSINKLAQGQHLKSALWFAVLINLKHIYLYIAPAYLVFMLRNYCFSSNKDGSLKWSSFSPLRFVGLGVAVLSVCAASLGPFIYMGQLEQLGRRLFPFKRGLCHAYWAPNFWALYNIADKAAHVIGVKSGLVSSHVVGQASMTGGLVQESTHAILPTISPLITLALTVFSILPALMRTWLYPGGRHTFLRCLTLCAYGAFMFGWHVHEKAVLMMIIPLVLLAVDKQKDAHCFLLLSTVGHFSLFPLIFTQPETPLKYSMMAAYSAMSFLWLGKIHNDFGSWNRLPLLTTAESIYIVGLLPLEIYCAAIHSSLGLAARLPFLPLMLTSGYTAIGVTYTWIKLYSVFLGDRSLVKAIKTE